MSHFCRFASLLTIAVVSQAAHSQEGVPSAGDLLRQVTPPPPPALPQPVLPGVGNLPPAPMRALPPGGQQVQVNRIDIVGNRVIDRATLQQLVDLEVGKSMTLANMEELATGITRFYRSRGYFVARAYVPEQDVTDGTLRLQVVEGNYGRFVLTNRSIVRDDVVQGLLDDIKDRDIVSLDTLERAMLIINDTPGSKVVRADVMPGERVGTSDFAIGTEATPRLDGFVLVDNHGSRYTGRDRVSFGGNWNSPSQRGDRLGVSGLATVNGNLLNARAAYSALVRSDGTRLEAAAGRTTYNLGGVYAALDATGTADSYELNVSHPWKRTRNASLALGVGYVHRELRDEVGAVSTRTSKRSDAIAFRADGNWTHPWMSLDGLTTLQTSVTVGRLALNDATAKAQDAAGARTAGEWSKLNLAVSRISLLPNDLQLTALARLQTTLGGRNLDGSERLTVSGAGNVSAYPMGELAGDQALVTRLELTVPMGLTRDVALQGTVFTSWGMARAAHPVGSQGSTRQLADFGVGLNVSYRNALLRIVLPTRLHGGAPTSESVPKTRVLVQASFTL